MERPEIAPSFFVRYARRYLQWCDVVQCTDCGLTAKYEDMHPVNPCPLCGNKRIHEVVGRWIPKKYPIWRVDKLFHNEGCWEVKSDVKE